jgi:hypothetical protein
MKTLTVFLGVMLCMGISLSAQIAINTDGSDPNSSAMLDVSSNDKGVLLPRVSIANLATEAPLTAPVENGMLVYNTNATTGTGFYIWNGSAWVRVATLADVHTGASKMVFRAEYSGATLMADGSNNTGYMTSDNSGGTESWMNYYEWTSSEATLQDYDVILRVTLPDDFKSWQASAIVIDYKTTNAATTENSVAIAVYDEASGTPVASVSATASTSWTTVSIPSTSLASLTAGETLAIGLKLSGRNNEAARVGDVTLNYNK